VAQEQRQALLEAALPVQVVVEGERFPHGLLDRVGRVVVALVVRVARLELLATQIKVPVVVAEAIHQIL
jgi:hypothetical protein